MYIAKSCREDKKSISFIENIRVSKFSRIEDLKRLTMVILANFEWSGNRRAVNEWKMYSFKFLRDLVAYLTELACAECKCSAGLFESTNTAFEVFSTCWSLQPSNDFSNICYFAVVWCTMMKKVLCTAEYFGEYLPEIFVVGIFSDMNKDYPKFFRSISTAQEFLSCSRV